MIYFQSNVEWKSTDPVAFQVISQESFLMEMSVHIDKTKALTDICHRTQVYWCGLKSFAYPIKHLNEFVNNNEFGNCFFMSLLNLAAPTWEKVNCNQPFVDHVFCQLENKAIHQHSLQIHPDSKSCLKGYIQQNNTCYHFIWHKLGTNIQETCPLNRLTSFHIEQFQSLFDAVTDIFPPLFSPDLEYIITYKRFWNSYSYKLNPDYTEKEGMYICAKYQSEYFVGNHVFKCKYGVYISYTFVCNGEKNCPGDMGFDEVGCECPIGLNYTSQCKWIYTLSQTKKCSDFYFKNWDGTCKSYDRIFLNGKEFNPSVKNIAKQGPFYLQQQNIHTSQWREIITGKLSCQSMHFVKITSMIYQTFVPTN